MKRRDAQAVCPSVQICDHDPESDARAFQKVLDVVDRFVPRVEVVEPGICLFPTIGPARYHGGEESLAAQLLDAIELVLGPDGDHVPSVGIAVAGGPRLAAIAALDSIRRRWRHIESDRAPRVLPKGTDAVFVGPLSIGYIESIVGSETVGLLRSLGIRTMGDFANLPPKDVLARFGTAALDAHRLVNGEDRDQLNPAEYESVQRAERAMEPPVETVDQVGFIAKVMADDLVGDLKRRGLTAGGILITVELETGRSIERIWRTERTFSVVTITQRVRWQLEGWLASGKSHSVLQGGISLLRLEPLGVRPDRGEQIGFWGGTDQRDVHVMNGIARIQGLFGHDSVKVLTPKGGRSPVDAYQLVMAEQDDSSQRTVGSVGPWPGSIPAPSPSLTWRQPVPAVVVDQRGDLVGVSGRGVITSAPAFVSIADGPEMIVKAWSGPWCIDERWWDPLLHRRKARVQVLLVPSNDVDAQDSPHVRTRPIDKDESAHPSRMSGHLLTLEGGRWWVEATYD